MLDALAEVEVTVNDVGTSGFQLTFSIDKQSPLQILFLLTGGLPLLFMRVVLVATVNGVANVLIDGVITNNQIAPGDKGSNSTLTLTGEDLTALMDQSNWSGFPFPAMPGGGARRLAAGQVRGLRRRPADHSERHDRHSVADRSDPRPAGHRPRIHPVPGGARRLRLLPRSRSGAGHEQGLLGTADQRSVRCSPRSAPTWTLTPMSRACISTSTRSRTRFRSCTSTTQQTGITIPIPIPPITPLSPPLGAIPPLPTNILGDLKPFRDDLVQAADSAGDHDRPGGGGTDGAKRLPARAVSM